MNTIRAVPRRSVGAGAGLATLALSGLGVVYAIFGLRTGVLALPAFVPLYAWMLACAVSRRTLRPWRLSRLHGWHRAAALLASVGVFLLLWPAWSTAVLSVWGRADGGIALPGGGTFRHPSAGMFSVPFGSAVSAAPVLFVLACGWLILLMMLALPGRPGDAAALARPVVSRSLREPHRD